MKRGEEIVRRAAEKRGYSPFWMAFMAELDLPFVEAYEALYDVVGARGLHLPLKFKELVTVAVLAVQREDYGLREHIRRALRLGATPGEIAETLQAAYFHTGALTLAHGLKALVEVLGEPAGGPPEGG